MKRTKNKFFKTLIALLIIGGVSLYLLTNSSSGVKVAYGSSLESSTGTPVEAASSLSGSDKISSDISFLTTLVSLEKIKIDTTLFTNKSFTALQDNSVKIETVQAGRSNPFAPIGGDTKTSATTVISPKIITDQPTQITDKTAVLNGTINTAVGVTDIYFDYGITANVGTVTSTVTPSLVGTFIKNILGLTPKTNYFYRACAKINNVATCGDVISFNTK